MMIVFQRRSRKGAWIEMQIIISVKALLLVAPVRERGLKFPGDTFTLNPVEVAPVRERGLKSHVIIFL